VPEGFAYAYRNRNAPEQAVSGAFWAAILFILSPPAMFRILLSGALALAVVAEASAQSAPANTTRATTTKTTAHTATKSRTATRKTTATRTGAANASAARAAGGRDDVGPGGNGAVGSTETADGKGQNAYAAPGMPVNVDNPKKVGGYNGPAPTRAKSRTTLTPR
jgi:hypothetical protein